jgi:hypothetical protein
VVVAVVVVAAGFGLCFFFSDGPIRTSFGVARYDEYHVSW